MGTLTEKPPVAETPFANASLSERTKITKFAKARLNATDITYIETSFSQLAENGEQLIADFYRALFQLQPELSGLFEINSEKGQHKKMLAALTLLVNNLRYPDVLDEYLTTLGMRHQIYGVSEGQMRLVSVALMSVLKQHAGAAWQAETERAWREMLIYVTNTMLGAYQPTEEHTMAVTVLNEDQHSSLLSGSPILDNANTAMMIVDRELTITYVNPSLTSQLVEHEAEFRQQSAGISVTQLVGTQVELLFPQPQQPRQLLTDPRQLPHTTELKIGSLIFRVTSSALWQGKDCAGMLLEWHNVTAEILRNADINGQFEALERVMGIISFNMDGTIIDVNDNFLSVVGYRKEEVVGHHHRLFVTPEYAVSREYQDFWSGLNRSEPQSGEFHRVGFGGKSIWLQASYIPIFDTNGIPYKVVKYASDITEEKLLQMTVESVLSATAVVMKAMAAGDLTQQLQGEYEDEFAQLQAAVNDTVVNMATIVQDISDASISISAAASEISQGNLDLSQRTEEQAASLEETASSLEELTSTVRQNSDNARHANQLASDARERAEKGGGVIKRAIDAMTAISQSSKKVADIIGVIDEIAFQTNLLALNAAVEAARAGEQGRGFAVVAAEVRNLAQRSAAAAKEIKELIRDSGEKVSEGASLVDESGRTLDDIVESAKKVGDIISEIAAASIEQTAGIEQVNKAVTQMDEMTQQNAALVEQAAAASESLDEQGQNLQQKMAFFNTGKRVEPAMIQPAVRAIPPRQTATTPVKSRRVALQSDDEWQEF